MGDAFDDILGGGGAAQPDPFDIVLGGARPLDDRRTAAMRTIYGNPEADPLSQPGAQRALRQGALAAKDFAINTAKDDVTTGAAMLVNPLAGIVAHRAAGKVLRTKIPGEPDKSVGAAALEGAIQGGIEGVGNAAGAGLAAVATKLPSALGARLDKSKIVKALTEYAKGIIKRGGDPKALKATGGKLIEEARRVAGDVPIDVSNFSAMATELRAGSQNPLAGGLDDAAKEILDSADSMAKREGGAKATLAELQDAISKWGKREKAWANDKIKQHTARSAKEALQKDLDAALENTALADAVPMLKEGRAVYGKGARMGELDDLLLKAEDPKSLDRSVSPSRIAYLGSGKNRAKVEKLFGDDKAALADWNRFVDASKVLSSNGKSWFPEWARIPKLQQAIDNVLTYRKVMKIFGDTEARRMLTDLISPDESMTPEVAMATLGQINARISDVDDRALRLVAERETTREPLATRSPAGKY